MCIGQVFAKSSKLRRTGWYVPTRPRPAEFDSNHDTRHKLLTGKKMDVPLTMTSELPALTQKIVETYRQLEGSHHLGHCPLPNVDAVIEIAQDLKELLFPGYRRRQDLTLSNIEAHVAELLFSLHRRLTQQCARALQHEYRKRFGLACGDEANQDFGAQGEEKAMGLLSSIPELRRTLSLDVQAAFDGDPAAGSLDEIIFCYPGFEAVTVYRIAHELHRLGTPLIPRMLSEWAHSRTGIDIHPGANIGPSFFIDHGTGVVVGETCDIAAHVKLYQGVTLGALSFPKDEQGNLIRKKKRHPTLHEGVVIYANATVLGGETVVGANSVIGASVSLRHSVPANSIVTSETPSPKVLERSAKKTG